MQNTDFALAPNVVIGIKDLLDMWEDANYWRGETQKGIAMLGDIARKYPSTNFIVLTSLENIKAERVLAKNITFIPWGGDCVNQHEKYVKHVGQHPVLDKDFASQRHVISLNRNLREHRIVYICYLFGENLDSNVELSCLGLSNVVASEEPQNLLDRIPWEFDSSVEHARIRESLNVGYSKYLYNENLVVDDYSIYTLAAPNDNLSNFNNSLRYKYQYSFVEIVTESSFSTPSYMITEKTIHAFYGCNFPIILGGRGIIEHLRQLGFDMFDDIVDHGYDSIRNPLNRIIKAIDGNRRLITDADYAKDMWAKNKDRFAKNVEVANKITDYYADRAKTAWSAIQWK
jgi:hypothetical protein